jgi:hypothetical protein
MRRRKNRVEKAKERGKRGERCGGCGGKRMDVGAETLDAAQAQISSSFNQAISKASGLGRGP